MDTLEVWWEGWDGSRWNLLDPAASTFAVALEGLGLPGFTQQWRKSGTRDGARYEGTTWDNNLVTATIQVGDTYGKRRTGDAWRQLDRAFRKSFSAEKEGRLVVVSGAGRRHLSLRLDAPFPIPGIHNPALSGSATYVISLTAGDEPWWVGEDVELVFAWTQDDTPFFSETGTAEEVGLYVAVDSNTENAGITNEGDRRAWPRWWAEGPFDEVRIGVGDEHATIPISVGADQRIYVDSYKETITDESGNSLWQLMGFADPTFAFIPAGGRVPLSLDLVEAQEGAKIGVAITPRYEGPW